MPLTSNMAFEPLLGTLTPWLMFTMRDARNLAGKIEQLTQISKSEKIALGKELRTMVVQRHSVQGLMDRLLEMWCRGGR